MSCIAADNQGKWLVTADNGPENVLIIWDSEYCTPIRTLFLSLKISKVALSVEAKYLLTLFYKEKAILYFWIWSFGVEEPQGIYDIYNKIASYVTINHLTNVF